MITFCISLGLTEEGHENLKFFIDRLDLTFLDRNAFLHTSLFQGVANSLDEITNWSNHDECFIKKDNILNAISSWDHRAKSLSRISISKFNHNLSAVCMDYSYSCFLIFLASKISRELSSLKIIKSHEDIFVESINLYQKNSTHFNYALDYQYKAYTGNVIPHTTLGFSKNPSEIIDTFNSYLNQVFPPKILHGGIYLTLLDEFCMTPTLDRFQVAKLI